MKSRYRREIIKGLSLLTQLGVTMAACVLIGIWIGKALDAIAGTSPLLLFVFMIFGVMAAFKSMFSIITKDWKKEHEHF